MPDNTLPKPVPLPVNFDNVPSELQYPNNWVNWRYTWKEKEQKWDKPLFNPQDWNASATAPHTWSPFTEVQRAYRAGKFDGVGFVMQKSSAESQLIGIDFDKCRDSTTGEILPDVKAELDLLDSYTEISPSATGIRVFVKGDIPDNGRKNTKNHREIYKHAHYLTVTGQRLMGYPAKIEARPKEVLEFFNKHFTKENSNPAAGSGLAVTCDLTDEEIKKLASEAANGSKFRSLMAGSTAGYLSASEADEALAFL